MSAFGSNCGAGAFGCCCPGWFGVPGCPAGDCGAGISAGASGCCAAGCAGVDGAFPGVAALIL